MHVPAEMEQPTNSTIFVAPLQINKTRSRKSSTISASSATTRRRSQTRQSTQITTPPATPVYESSEAKSAEDDGQETQFHHYLRAFYPFHPPCDQTTSTVTLPLNQGDIVLVHSVHTNGWADGTLLLSGARGWLPTNYCEAFDHQQTGPLMKALTNFWDVVRGCSDGDFAPLRNQDYMRGLIAGVRMLLENTSCLNRESPLVVSHEQLRRNRKALLSYLSILVKSAKQLQDILESERSTVTLDDGHLDDLVLKAFRMALRGVKFFDVWVEDIELSHSIDASIAALETPHTPPADKAMLCIADDAMDAASRPVAAVETNVTRRNSSALNEPIRTRDSREQTNGQARYNRISQQSCARPGSSQLPFQPSRPPSAQTKRQSVSHRVSYSLKSGISSNGCLASEKLTVAHDVLSGFLAGFISLHVSSRSSTQVLLTVQQALNAGRGLLAVVEAVWDRDYRRSDSLEASRDSMYSKITELVQAARDVFQPRSPVEGDVFDPSHGRLLEDAATACIRGAGDCVAKARFILEKIGDFEFETAGLGISVFDGIDTATPLTTPVLADEVEQDTMTIRSSSTPTPHGSQTANTCVSPASTLLRIDTSVSSMSNGSDYQRGVFTPPLTEESAHDILPPLPNFTTSPLLSQDDYASSPASHQSENEGVESMVYNARSDSIAVLSIGSATTSFGSLRNSERTSTSTRATSPDTSFCHSQSLGVSPLAHSYVSALDDECEETEEKLLEKTFAHELIFNKDGQVSGGSLPALIERLTTHDSTPDALFVSTFYLTFRLFTTPCSFAQALIDRFDYVHHSQHVTGPVRLRVYNVFKGWLESHWRMDCDQTALDLIFEFSVNKLSDSLPAAGKRLMDLATKVSSSSIPLVPRLISSIGKTNTAVGQYIAPDTPLPAPIISKSQLGALKNWKYSGASVSILHFDPLELARQFTIKESRIFCSILPEELLATEWTKKSGSMAVNVRAMSTLSTDLANLVVDSILQLEDAHKRAKLIKQWIKIASKCLELNNYDSLMAIICSLNTTGILRLKRTWEIISSKTKITLEALKDIVDCSKNYRVLRQRLSCHVSPCLPFVGIYLTDLTFVDAGNQSTRQLPGSGPDDTVSVINFDKHVKTARIISELQRFQLPYRLQEVPELQTWIQDQLVRVRSSETSNMSTHWRRSLLLEPRETTASKPSESASMRTLLWPTSR